MKVLIYILEWIIIFFKHEEVIRFLKNTMNQNEWLGMVWDFFDATKTHFFSPIVTVSKWKKKPMNLGHCSLLLYFSMVIINIQQLRVFFSVRKRMHSFSESHFKSVSLLKWST